MASEYNWECKNRFNDTTNIAEAEVRIPGLGCIIQMIVCLNTMPWERPIQKKHHSSQSSCQYIVQYIDKRAVHITSLGKRHQFAESTPLRKTVIPRLAREETVVRGV